MKGDLSCNSKNAIYLITCKKCKDEYIDKYLVLRYTKIQIIGQVQMNDSKKKMKKCFGIEKDTGKVKYSQLPNG